MPQFVVCSHVCFKTGLLAPRSLNRLSLVYCEFVAWDITFRFPRAFAAVLTAILKLKYSDFGRNWRVFNKEYQHFKSPFSKGDSVFETIKVLLVNLRKTVDHYRLSVDFTRQAQQGLIYQL